MTAVSSDVSGVKTDVGGVKTDVGKTQSDLATAISQLTSMKGDLSDHSSLIARNHDELELLKHKGDRNYYEFTLTKGQRKPVGTVSLELKKADAKKSKFTLVVYSDDKQYEKKDRNLNEPLQFYSGKDPHALRDRGELRGRKEPDHRLSDDAQETRRRRLLSITAVWGASTTLGWYWKAKVKFRSLRASHSCLVSLTAQKAVPSSFWPGAIVVRGGREVVCSAASSG